VLVVAGKLKRADPDRSEEEVLMRALRDFNIPKIVNEDLTIFKGLIVDLFPVGPPPPPRPLPRHMIPLFTCISVLSHADFLPSTNRVSATFT
jgi:hypothetical protein